MGSRDGGRVGSTRFSTDPAIAIDMLAFQRASIEERRTLLTQSEPNTWARSG